MITLYGSGPAYGVNDLSPFVVKAATYLRLAGIEYRQKPGNPRTAPKQKIPYLRDGDVVVCDSSAIIDHLRAKHRDLDEGLTARDRATATAVKAMFEEHYYFCIMYQRWQDERGWAVQREGFQASLRSVGAVPSLLLPLVVRQVRGVAMKMLRAQGTGRHSVAEMEAIACSHIDAAAELMGDRPYFLGDGPRSIDATVWAFLACTTGFPVKTSLHERIASKPNLTAYIERVRSRFWEKA